MKLILATLAISFSVSAYAACRVHFVNMPNGQTMICTTCCTDSGICNTFCS